MKNSLIISIVACLIAVIGVILVFVCLPSDGKDGADGVTPTIEISEDGYWVINGEKTNVSAKGDGSSSADENPQGLQFYPQDDGTYIVSCGDAKYLSEIVIPATYKGGAVVGIDNEAFKSCTNLTSIEIPESVTNIGDRAFRGCTSLTSVEIPDSVTSIGDYAFCDCTSLTSIEIPDRVTSIGYLAFCYCRSLTSIKYRGTEEQWNAISKGSSWDSNTGDYTITYNYKGEYKAAAADESLPLFCVESNFCIIKRKKNIKK